MLGINDWMRLWGLDPKTGWPVVWSVWWPWMQSTGAFKAQSEMNVAADLPYIEPVECVDPSVFQIEAASEKDLDELDTQIGLAVAPTAEPVKKAVSRKRAPKANSTQTPLDLGVAAVKTKPIAKNTRAKKSQWQR